MVHKRLKSPVVDKSSRALHNMYLNHLVEESELCQGESLIESVDFLLMDPLHILLQGLRDDNCRHDV